MSGNRLKALVAIDSFKGSLSSRECANIVCTALELEGISTEKMLIGDGGEGTAEAIVNGRNFQKMAATVTLLSGELGDCVYYQKGSEAVLECAEVVGLCEKNREKDGLFNFSTYGLGELFLHAIENGARDITICLGGSGTNDCGAGFLQAIGGKFLSKDRQILQGYPRDLRYIHEIDLSAVDKRVKECHVTALCDVKNTLCGNSGASYTFGRQKGASEEGIVELDKILQRFSSVLDRTLGVIYADSEGSGAAGGLGYIMLAVLNAEYISGIEYMLSKQNFLEKIEACDFVISGEGRIDNQTLQGKVISGIMRQCESMQKPLYLLCGSSEIDSQSLSQNVKYILPLVQNGITVDYAIKNSRELLFQRAVQLAKICVKSGN